jgi:hypothetical protein
MQGEYGLRWREWKRRTNELVTKERFFPTAEKRERFASDVSERDTFHEFVAWCDPRDTVH